MNVMRKLISLRQADLFVAQWTQNRELVSDQYGLADGREGCR